MTLKTNTQPLWVVTVSRWWETLFKKKPDKPKTEEEVLGVAVVLFAQTIMGLPLDRELALRQWREATPYTRVCFMTTFRFYSVELYHRMAKLGIEGINHDKPGEEELVGSTVVPDPAGSSGDNLVGDDTGEAPTIKGL